jgi:hypothetical protein
MRQCTNTACRFYSEKRRNRCSNIPPHMSLDICPQHGQSAQKQEDKKTIYQPSRNIGKTFQQEMAL